MISIKLFIYISSLLEYIDCFSVEWVASSKSPSCFSPLQWSNQIRSSTCCDVDNIKCTYLLLYCLSRRGEHKSEAACIPITHKKTHINKNMKKGRFFLFLLNLSINLQAAGKESSLYFFN
ncbi:unnamed protein product [Linum tenue]|uniref:Secreted protein n=1 Tax=Linum tenue TaxID=586396 RepID=A0AAV0MAT5_9ROSI|nr:unnamed protein product [Linum tenue]